MNQLLCRLLKHRPFLHTLRCRIVSRAGAPVVEDYCTRCGYVHKRQALAWTYWKSPSDVSYARWDGFCPPEPKGE